MLSFFVNEKLKKIFKKRTNFNETFESENNTAQHLTFKLELYVIQSLCLKRINYNINYVLLDLVSGQKKNITILIRRSTLET